MSRRFLALDGHRITLWTGVAVELLQWKELIRADGSKKRKRRGREEKGEAERHDHYAATAAAEDREGMRETCWAGPMNGWVVREGNMCCA